MDFLSPDGPVYQAGTLSGNPLAMAAGLAQLRTLESTDGWARLEAVGAAFESATRAAIGDRPLTFQRIGSMFCLYFHPGPIWNLGDAQQSDKAAFNRFFHHCLKQGVYFAPSQFEAGFLCTEHDAVALDRTASVVCDALAA
jgi:glutamate-1-semialdehyde 2,1-aminomutase